MKIMLALSSTSIYELYVPPTDMRKSFDSLCGLLQTDLSDDPTNGSVYIFINKRKNKAKILQWQSGGFILYYKRLETGVFELPVYDGCVLSMRLNYTQLVLLIDGVSITNITRKKRYQK